MKPSELLRTLRAKGFNVRIDDRQLVVSGPVPRHEERALEQLRASRDDLLVLVETEAHPAVATALDVFAGAELREVRPAAPHVCDGCKQSSTVLLETDRFRGRGTLMLCINCSPLEPQRTINPVGSSRNPAGSALSTPRVGQTHGPRGAV